MKLVSVARLAPVAAIYTRGCYINRRDGERTTVRADEIVVVRSGESSFMWRSNTDLNVSFRVSVVGDEVVAMTIDPFGATVVAVLGSGELMVLKVQRAEVRRINATEDTLGFGFPRVVAAWPHEVDRPESVSVFVSDDAGERILSYAESEYRPLRIGHESTTTEAPLFAIPSERGDKLLVVRRLSVGWSPDQVSRIEVLDVDVEEESVLVAAAVADVCDVLMMPADDVVLVFARESTNVSVNIYARLSAHTWIRTQRVFVSGTGLRLQPMAASPCGRYVLHINENQEQATSSVIDLRCATFPSGVVVYQMAIAKEVVPKAVAWNTAGVWLKSPRGVVLLEL